VNRLAAAALLALACGGGAKLTEECTVNRALGTSSCEGGLRCIVPDGCTADCKGKCAKPCKNVGDCPNNCSCSGQISDENGGGTRCMGNGC
jgi:hypothetical protein